MNSTIFFVKKIKDHGSVHPKARIGTSCGVLRHPIVCLQYEERYRRGVPHMKKKCDFCFVAFFFFFFFFFGFWKYLNTGRPLKS